MAKSRIRLFNQGRSAQPPATDASVGETAVAKDRSALFNQLAFLFLLFTPLVLAVYLLIFFVPQIPINPLRPITVSFAALTPAPTRTPTETATPTNTPHPTNTPTETSTPTPTNTPTAVVTVTIVVKPGSTRTPTPTPTPAGLRTPTPTRSPFNYVAELNYQKAQLVYTANWTGIAGLVLDPKLQHQQNITVHAWGDDPLGPTGKDVLSGEYTSYGASGWEFTLGDKLMFGTWHVQLVDDQGNPLSDVVDVTMQGDPRTNLAFIIFTQNH